MDVQYVTKGEENKTCADCKNFEKANNEGTTGLCFGYEVLAGGSCSYFTPKD